MRELGSVLGWRWGVVLVGLLAGACVSDGGGGDADGGKANQSCEDGKEGCACYGNGTCDKGLSCLSRLCVNTEGDKADDEAEADASSAPAAERDAEADDAPSKPAKDDANDDTASNDDATADQDDAPPDEPTDDAKPESDDSSSEPATDDDEPVETSDEPDDGPSDASMDESTDTTSDEPTSEPTSDDTGTDEPVSDDTETSDATTDDDTDPPPPPPMGELIVNGDFQDGIAGWNIETTTTATPDTTSGDLCLRPLVEYDYVYGPVGWPLDPLDGFALESGATYEFSFDAYITSDAGSVVEFEAKVGEAETPYTPVFTWTPSVSSEPTRFAAQFVSDYSFEHAGIVFTIYTTIDVCIGNVSMTRVE